jgi:hypothetical protein
VHRGESCVARLTVHGLINNVIDGVKIFDQHRFDEDLEPTKKLPYCKKLNDEETHTKSCLIKCCLIFVT